MNCAKAERRAQQANGITLRAALAQFIEDRKTLRPRTIADYRDVTKLYLSDWLDRPLASLTREMVKERHASIAAEIAARARRAREEAERTRKEVDGAPRPYFPPAFECNGEATANRTLRVFRLLYNAARITNPNLPENPVTLLSLARAWHPQRRRTDIVPASELAAFYKAAISLSNEEARDYLLLVLFSGLRRREASALRWEEIDLTSKVIRLPERRTKAGRRLDLPMSDFLVDLFTRRRAMAKPGPWCFPADSRSGHIEEPRFALVAVARAMGTKVTVHGLRRTFITVAEATEMSPYALKGLVNHSFGSDVTATYIVSGAERLREPMQRVTDRLKALCGIDAPKGKVVRLRRAA
jgi:integrase